MPNVFPRWLVGVLCAVLCLGDARQAFAYLKFGHELHGVPIALMWRVTPVPYYVSDNGVPGVMPDDFQAAVARAFATWEAVPTAAISYRFAGFTSSRPGQDDGRSTLGFRSEPSLDRVLASTTYLIDGITGELLESDIFFNSAFPWTASDAAVTGRWDLQTIALHEIGHFNGLGHSAIGETTNAPGGRRVLSTGAVMFPIALGAGEISGRELQADDIAGVSDIYPAGEFMRSTGSISGQVTRDGRGLFGAHVVAFDPANGSQIGNFTLSSDGRFSIAGLRPGPHLLRVEPLDDADLESFFGAGEPVDIAFAPRFFDRLVVVPRGGDSGSVVIPVSTR